MHLELALRKPGFRAVFLEKVPENQRSGLSLILRGNEQSESVFLWSANGDTATANLIPNRDVIREAEQNSASAYRLVEKRFLLGTDLYGRDVWSRILLGTRISLSVGLISVLISLILGVLLGMIAGYYRGWVDKMVMWLVNVVWSLPTLLLVIALTFALGKGFWQIFVAVGLTMWVELARIVRAQVFTFKNQEFVQAARVLGYSDMRIMLRHILPNLTGPVIVICAANFASAILLEAGLSFLGLGVQPPYPSWGQMLKENYSFIAFNAAHLALAPGMAIMLLVVSFNYIGNWLRDLWDVKL
ncbi:MAG: ABC transporter permease [Flavobacteriales bacterium]|nr:ABC transporter permease [Flavobacteriales bacterium]